METLAQIAKKVRSGLKATHAEVEGIAFSVRVISGTLNIEITQVRGGFKVLTPAGSLTAEAIEYRQSIEAYARRFTQPFDRIHVRYSNAIHKSEQARIANSAMFGRWMGGK